MQMKIKELLLESMSDIAYHYTSINSAAKIMSGGEFVLSRSTGNPSEEAYAPPGYDYFLSTTRSKVGDYHRYASNGAVMFVLDGQWFNSRYVTKPVDYWAGMWQHSPDRTRESEDRVFSKTPTIPLTGVTAIHLFLSKPDKRKSPLSRNILLAGKKLGIPVYIYNHEQAWRLQDTRRALTIAQAGDLLKGVTPDSYRSRPGRDFLEPWLELIYKKNKTELSPRAEQLRHNLVVYGSRYENDDNGLSNALSNERKPSSDGYDSATKIVNYMRKSELKSPLELKTVLCKKWEDIG